MKVVTDKDGYVLYFSRSVIPYDRDQFMQLEDTSKAQLLMRISVILVFMLTVRALLNNMCNGHQHN